METVEVDGLVSEPVSMRLFQNSFPPLARQRAKKGYCAPEARGPPPSSTAFAANHFPGSILAGLASAALVWNMYSLLTPIRYVLNPRFHLTTPMQSGLFYLAPGAGYLLGTFFGGRYADHVVRKHIARSGGVRHPEDRLRSALPFLGVVIPACVLVYGWCVQQDVGGVPVVVVVLFVQGVAQLFCFPSLNTYCLDVMQGTGSDVIAGNYFVRYLFACLGTAVVLPAVESVGVGWFSTVSAGFLGLSALGTWACVVWGRGWREGVDRKRRKRRVRGQSKGRKVGGKGGNGETRDRLSERDIEAARGELEVAQTAGRTERDGVLPSGHEQADPEETPAVPAPARHATPR